MQQQLNNQKKDSEFARNIFEYPNIVTNALLGHYYRRLQEEDESLNILRFSETTDAQGKPKLDSKHVFTRSDNRKVLIMIQFNKKGFPTVWTT